MCWRPYIPLTVLLYLPELSEQHSIPQLIAFSNAMTSIVDHMFLVGYLRFLAKDYSFSI